MTRDSSPPEAPLAIGSSGAPGCATMTISTWSTPSGPAATHRPSICTASGSAGSASRCATRTATTARPIASWSSSVVTELPRVWAAALPARRDRLRRFGNGRPRTASSSACSAASRCSEESRFSSSTRGVRGPAQHGVDVLAVPPGQRAQRRLPGEHLLQPRRVGVQVRQVARQFGRHVDQRPPRPAAAGRPARSAAGRRTRPARAARPAPGRRPSERRRRPRRTPPTRTATPSRPARRAGGCRRSPAAWPRRSARGPRRAAARRR